MGVGTLLALARQSIEYASFPLSSSAIAAIDYYGSRLTVTFTDGSDYDYEGVPPEVVIELVNAGSAGRYFNANIRNEY